MAETTGRSVEAEVLYKPVDLSDFEARKANIGQELLKAATVTGFWDVVGHGIPQVSWS